MVETGLSNAILRVGFCSLIPVHKMEMVQHHNNKEWNLELVLKLLSGQGLLHFKCLLSEHASQLNSSTHTQMSNNDFSFNVFFSPKTVINGEKSCRFTASLTHKLQESYRKSLDVLMATVPHLARSSGSCIV